ncbi:MAG: methyltransferase domain-containing protein [Patescibacteria group bacterium]
MWKLAETVEERTSKFNGAIKVVKGLEGTRIIVGGLSQSGWLVKKVWKDALKKIKKLKPNAKDILVLGLGGGSIAELLQEYWPDSRKVGVDIDPEMVDLGRKYLKLNEVKDLEVVIADVSEWIVKNVQKFDLILVDLYKGGSIPQEFREEAFLNTVQKTLKPDSIAAFNHLYSSLEKKDAEEFRRRLRNVFPVMTVVTPEANMVVICHQ